MSSPTVVIVGAGIIGASVAYRLASAGARVRVVERDEPGRGTTAASFAWLNANQKTPRAYFALNVAGMSEHRALAAEFSDAPWFHPDGNLIWADPDGLADLQDRVERLRSWEYAAEWIDARTANTELEPGAAFPSPETPVAWFPEEGWVDAPALCARLLRETQRASATLTTGSAVMAIETVGGEISGVTLASGERIAADIVVNAAGPHAPEIAAQAGVPLPFAPVPGLLVRLAHPADPVRRPLHAPRVNVRPDGSGHLILQAAELDDHLGERRALPPTDPLIAEILVRGIAAVPALASANLAEIRIGVRPIPADTFPSVGTLDAPSGYVEAVTHSGITLGPLLGRLIAQEILTGEHDPLLAPFSPGRLRSLAS